MPSKVAYVNIRTPESCSQYLWLAKENDPELAGRAITQAWHVDFDSDDIRTKGVVHSMDVMVVGVRGIVHVIAYQGWNGTTRQASYSAGGLFDFLRNFYAVTDIRTVGLR